MKTLKKENRGPVLIKQELKFGDFWVLTKKFNARNSLSEKKKTELAMRVHSFVFYMREIILSYLEQNDKVKKGTNISLEKQFREMIRRIKISFALNKSYYRQSVEYWKEIADILISDALLLKDKELAEDIGFFREQLEAIRFK